MTGLIYVAIIAVWAVVLVPKWLKRHDRLDPERSVQRFSRTMQTLATRPTVLGIPLPEEGEQEWADETTRPIPAPAEVVAASGPRGTRGASPRPTARPAGGTSTQRSVARRTSAASRRRVVLGVLGAGTLGALVMVVLGLLSPLLLVVPVGLLGGFVLLARHQVRTAAAAAGAAQAQAAPTWSAAPAPGVRPAAPAAGATWDARETPLPRYVTEAAGDAARGSAPGAWTAAAMLERAQQERLRAERMAEAKARAIAKAKEEQDAAESRSRDEEYLAAEAVWPPRRRAVNE